MRVRSVGHTLDVANWYNRLMSDPFFVKKVKSRFTSLRQAGQPWSKSQIEQYFISAQSEQGGPVCEAFHLPVGTRLCFPFASGLREATGRDLFKYNKGEIDGVWDFEVQTLKTWYVKRVLLLRMFLCSFFSDLVSDPT